MMRRACCSLYRLGSVSTWQGCRILGSSSLVHSNCLDKSAQAQATTHLITALSRATWRQFASATDQLRILHPWINEEEFSDAADETLELVQDRVEAYLDRQNIDGCDVEMGQGVLTIKLGEHGTYVINKQTPNRQIWLSSPVSGPLRFDYMTSGRWVYHRDGRDLLNMLTDEFDQLCGAALDLK